MPFTDAALNRRTFLTGSVAAVAGVTLLREPVAATEPPPLSLEDLTFASGIEAARAIRRGDVSSVELTSHVLKRIERHNGKVTAMVSVDPERALAAAKAADEALAKGEWRGPYHGVPWGVKDTYEVAGLKTTAGDPRLKDYVSGQDAVTVQRMHHAGAICIGKTNVPLYAADMQTFNDVYGTTNNPWDVSKSPGGSTGGGAAALVAGFCYLALGSDIGGSIRNPANFCGVYGHKPTYNVVPTRGELASLPGGQPYPPDELSCAGPLARSAADLRQMLEILGGPDDDASAAYVWKMPQPRGTRLNDFRVGYVLDDPLCPVVPEVKEKLLETIEALRNAGVKVEEGWPEGIHPGEQYATYAYLLLASYIQEQPEAALAELREAAKSDAADLLAIRARAWSDTHRGFDKARREQIIHRAAWREWFKTHDVFLLPTAFTTAFDHVQSTPLELRTIQTSLGSRAYTDLLFYISFATMTGNPATVAPVGLAGGKLPVGIQIMGPYMEDGTSISFAGLLADIAGGFAVPPGYQ